MTTAGRPTFDPAKGGSGLHDGHKISQQKSSLDQPAHLKLKERAPGQDTSDELVERDFKAELEARERKIQEEKILHSSSKPTVGIGIRPRAIAYDYNHLEASTRSRAESRSPNVRKSASEDLSPIEDRSIVNQEGPDHVKDDDEDYEDSDDDDDDDDEEDEDDEAALLAELEKIRKERALEREKREAEEMERKERLAGGSTPSSSRGPTSFTIKRPWDDDVPFKHCSRGSEDPEKKVYINHTLRSESHKKFMDKYIR